MLYVLHIKDRYVVQTYSLGIFNKCDSFVEIFSKIHSNSCTFCVTQEIALTDFNKQDKDQFAHWHCLVPQFCMFLKVNKTFLWFTLLLLLTSNENCNQISLFSHTTPQQQQASYKSRKLFHFEVTLMIHFRDNWFNMAHVDSSSIYVKGNFCIFLSKDFF